MRLVRCGLMTTPQQPKDPPVDPAPTTEHAHGVPDGAEDGDAKGMPNSDRHQTESSPGRIEKEG